MKGKTNNAKGKTLVKQINNPNKLVRAGWQGSGLEHTGQGNIRQ